MKVFVYRNLHRGCLSVRDVKTRRVIAYVDSITLEGVRFKVSKKLRQRVLNENRKNVHAGVEGVWIKNARAPTKKRCIKIIYNPYKYSSFVEERTLEPMHECDKAYVTIGGALVCST
jgi:hypothetical protein